MSGPRRSGEGACIAGDADDDFRAGEMVLEEVGDGGMVGRSSGFSGGGGVVAGAAGPGAVEVVAHEVEMREE